MVSRCGFVGVFALLFLVSCHLMPSTVVPRVGGGNTLQGTVQVQPVSQSAPSLTPGLEMVTVHQESRAIRSPLQEPTAEVIAQLSGGAGLFVSRQATADGIQMPDVGAFEILFRQGTQYCVIDGDARDGKAVVELPEGVYHFGLQAGEGWSARSALTFVDDLYYLRDTLRQSRHPWLASQSLVSLGVKPLPVPESWHGRAGGDVVLGFEAEDVESFRLVWKAQSDVAPYPPGVGKIGMAGGRLSLPGVGEIEIPEGALEKDEVISIKEILEHELFPGVLQLSSTVSIEPKDIILKKPILVRLDFYKEIVGENDPGVINYTFLKKNCDPESGSCIASLISNVHVEEMSLDSWHILSEIPEELYVTMLDIFTGKNTKVYSSRDSRFQTQQTAANSSNFIVRNTLPNTYSEQDVRMLLASLERGRRIYKESFGEPVPNLHDTVRSVVKILSTDAEGLQRFEVVVPNHVPPGTQVLLSSRGYTSEARYMPSMCQILPVDYRIQASGACT